jgi:hypothetical protein
VRKGASRRFGWVLGIALAVACAPREGVREPPNGEGLDRDDPSGVVTIQVTNQNTSQATIYIVQNEGIPMRVGEVPSLSERFFERTVWGAPSVQFDVRFLAGRTFRTASVVAMPGDTIHVTIPARR